MSADRLNAIGSIVLEGEGCETNIHTGNSSTRIFTGSKGQIYAQRMIELGFGASVTKIESTGDGNYKLTAGYSWDISGDGPGEKPTNIYELENTMEQVDVFNSDVMRAQLLTSASGNWATVNGWLALIKGRLDQWDAKVNKDSTDMTAVESGIPAGLCMNIFRGVAYHQIKTCPQYNTVYRRRITAATPGQINAAFTGKGKIWTTAEVVSFEGVPTAWWFALPAELVWLKTPPSVNTVAGQKTEITYHYIGAAYAWSAIFQAQGSATLVTF